MNWKPIFNYEDLYLVSDTGLVKSLGKNVKRGAGVFFLKGRILSPGKDKDGYLLVNLYKNGKANNKKIHRLIAETFLPLVADKIEVNHIDGDKTNNAVVNLEWCDRTENRSHMIATGLCKKSANRAVDQYSLCGNYLATYDSLNKAAVAVGSQANEISKAARGIYRQAAGYKWRFK